MLQHALWIKMESMKEMYQFFEVLLRATLFFLSALLTSHKHHKLMVQSL